MQFKDAIHAVCPKCGQPYTGRPAVSREDNSMLICPECGSREALESLGIDKDEQEQILVFIRQSQQNAR